MLEAVDLCSKLKKGYFRTGYLWAAVMSYMHNRTQRKARRAQDSEKSLTMQKWSPDRGEQETHKGERKRREKGCTVGDEEVD